MPLGSSSVQKAVLAVLALVAACTTEPEKEEKFPLPPDDSGCESCNRSGEPQCTRERNPASCFATLATYDGATDLSISVAWSPIDDFVLSGGDGEIRLLELTAEPAFRQVGVTREQAGRTDVAWSPDGAFALSASTDVRLLEIDRERGSITEVGSPYTGHFGDIYSVVWSPDGAHALSAGEDGTVQLLSVDLASGLVEEVGELFVGGKIYDLTFSPDGSLGALAAQDGTARVFAVEADGLRELSSVSMDSWVTAVAWSPGGSELLAGTWLPCNTLELFSVAHSSEALIPVSIFAGHTSGLRVLQFDRAGDVLVSAGHDDTVELFDFRGPSGTFEHLGTWSENTLGVHEVSFSADPARLVVAASHADRLTLLDASACLSAEPG